MDPLKGKYTHWQRLVHRYKARRDIPFRKQFFVGYDLHGNTYWEFTIDGNMQRLRRKLEPYKQLLFKSDYLSSIPPQWLQWLRRTRDEVPTLEELINDQVRQQKIKVLAQHADAKWTAEKVRLEQEQHLKLQQELERAKLEDEVYVKENKEKTEENKMIEEISDPWKQADKSRDENPVKSAFVKPRGEEKESSDPWKKADESKDQSPVESASIKPRN